MEDGPIATPPLNQPRLSRTDGIHDCANNPAPPVPTAARRMKSRLWVLLGVLSFVLGGLMLALTSYAWFGDWPQEVKEIVDYQRSLGERGGHSGDPLLQSVYKRAHRSLNGTWEAVIDPYGRGGDLAGIAPRASEPGNASDLAEFSFANGLKLAVPGDWNTQDPRLVFYQGIVWYKRSFNHRPQPGVRTFLWLGAANYHSSLYLNGTLLGRHSGGFTPFNYEITERLRPGENLLVARVDSRMTDADIPTATTDWHNYGGLTRDVLLVEVPETHIREYSIELVPGTDDRLRGHIMLDGPRRDHGAALRIPELDLSVAINTDAEGRGHFEVSASPELWSPDRPRLYRIALTTEDDSLIDEVGFRTVETKGTQMLLNGKPIFLRGISLHDEVGLGGGRGHNRADAERLLGWARELGCNFVRLAHYPHSQHLALVADRMGLLVWEEIPVYWSVDFASEHTLALAREQLSALIARDRNRASVILWSIGNETPGGADRLRFMTALAEHVRSLDASRLVTAALLTAPEELLSFLLSSYLPALLGFSPDEWSYPVQDPLAKVVDVPALNQYFGWYYSGALAMLSPFSSHYARRIMLQNMERIRIASPPGKPLIISELGAGALAGMHAPESELAVYSEEYQALVYRRQIAMLRNQTGVVGMAPWILKDFRSPLRLYQGVQDYWNRKGLIADDGSKKLAFSVLRDYYLDIAHREQL